MVLKHIKNYDFQVVGFVLYYVLLFHGFRTVKLAKRIMLLIVQCSYNCFVETNLFFVGEFQVFEFTMVYNVFVL